MLAEKFSGRQTGNFSVRTYPNLFGKRPVRLYSELAVAFSISFRKRPSTLPSALRKKAPPHFYAIGILHEKPFTIKNGTSCIRTNAKSKAPSALSFRAKGQSRELRRAYHCSKSRFLSGKDPLGERENMLFIKKGIISPFYYNK